MKYYSLNHQSPVTNFKEATIKGQAPDKGLYFPEYIPQVPQAVLQNLQSLSREEIAYTVIQPYVGDAIPENDLHRIVTETVNFPIPLVQIKEGVFSLELFHGPTLAFKDIGARFMSRCLGYFMGQQQQQKKVIVLVATSGDTGGAVANGFYDVEGVEVVILYPSGKVSSIQEKQLTTLGKNIRALEVTGTFDDCQQLVKQAFADSALTSDLFLTSANSINVARWLPQQFYYFFALQQWKEKEAPVIAVPSGNFGNICAGMLAHLSGLPVKHFIAACNANDVVTQYLHTQQYQPRPAVATISNAMDVGNPSNFIRIQELYQQQFGPLQQVLSSYCISDDTTKQVIKEVAATEDYLLDPHGAVAYKALQQYQQQHAGAAGFILETAHPVKFPDVVEEVTGKPVPVPPSVAYLLDKEKKSKVIAVSYDALKEALYEI
ncbi:MAG: threonine synthase [Sphingobacteriales bacterium]|nr:MAG: threonine synthase [Sphingobacteriales bacterium]